MIVFIALCSLAFYDFKAISFAKNPLELLGIITVIVLIILFLTYYKGHLFEIKMGFKVPILLMMFFVITSCFYANYNYGQNFVISLYQARGFFFFLLYFIYHIYTPKVEIVEKILLFLGITGAIIFVAQTLVYPVRIIDSKIFFDRNTLRIFMPGEVFRVIAYLISINKFFQTTKKKYLLYALLFLTVAVLVGSRTTLAFHILIPVTIIILQKRVKNRIAMLFVIAIAIFTGAILFWSIIEGMILVSQRNASQGDDYVRFAGIRYFIFDFNKYFIANFTGNGIPHESSAYARLMLSLRFKYGFYLSDIGLVGTFIKYGIIYVGICIYLIFYMILKKIPENIIYIKHYFLLLVLIAIFSYSPFEGGQGGVLIASLFYIVDKNRVESKKQSLSKKYHN